MSDELKELLDSIVHEVDKARNGMEPLFCLSTIRILISEYEDDLTSKCGDPD